MCHIEDTCSPHPQHAASPRSPLSQRAVARAVVASQSSSLQPCTPCFTEAPVSPARRREPSRREPSTSISGCGFQCCSSHWFIGQLCKKKKEKKGVIRAGHDHRVAGCSDVCDAAAAAPAAPNRSRRFPRSSCGSRCFTCSCDVSFPPLCRTERAAHTCAKRQPPSTGRTTDLGLAKQEHRQVYTEESKTQRAAKLSLVTNVVVCVLTSGAGIGYSKYVIQYGRVGNPRL